MFCEKVLIVDDDENFLNIYKKILIKKEYSVEIANDSRKAIEIIKEKDIDLVITDMYMPELNGIELIREIKQLSPNIEIVLVTGQGSIDNAVQAIKEGAFTYIQKPINIEELFLNIEKINNIRLIKKENEYLKKELNKGNSFIGNSKKIIEIKELVQRVAKSDSSILISGESGTGKELIAKSIHVNSNRNTGNLISVNCSALSEGILESELFGHEKGSFTGAISSKAGRFEMSDKGTLFLDEIGEMPHNIQVKLLRVLQEREFERVGGGKTIKSDFRLISATNRDLNEEIEKGNFREDLFYRINVIPIVVPPLRERKSDIPLFVEYFSNLYANELNKKPIRFTDDAINIFNEYHWPGNIRELKNIIERLIVLTKDKYIGSKDVVKCISIDKDIEKNIKNKSEIKPFRDAKREFETNYVKLVLKQYNYNITKSAECMGIARKNLYAKIKNLNLSID